LTLEVGAMMAAGSAALIAGLPLAQSRLGAADGPGKLIVLGPVFEASALAAFAAEHFTAAREMVPIVPHWLPAPLFWVYFFGVCLLATAVSFVLWRSVRASAALLALFFFLVVLTVSLPPLPRHLHDRLFWPAFVREIAFASGALILSGSLWPRDHALGRSLMQAGRFLLAPILIFYAAEHFLFPRYTPGVPLEKLTPASIPAPTIWAYLVGAALLLGGLGLLFRPAVRLAAAGTGLVLLLLTAFFYGPLLVSGFHSDPVEGLNYVFDTMLFAATVLLAGFAAEPIEASMQNTVPVRAMASSRL
jgi:uncharacterized membrane protein